MAATPPCPCRSAYTAFSCMWQLWHQLLLKVSANLEAWVNYMLKYWGCIKCKHKFLTSYNGLKIRAAKCYEDWILWRAKLLNLTLTDSRSSHLCRPKWVVVRGQMEGWMWSTICGPKHAGCCRQIMVKVFHSRGTRAKPYGVCGSPAC